MPSLLRALTSSPADAPATSVEAFWAWHRAESAGVSATFDRAALGGFGADRLGYAFLAGYQAALRALVACDLGEGLASLCATERGGAHPRHIQTALRPEGQGLVLSGQKRWATSGALARTLLVVASRGAGPEGRNQLAVVRVDAGAPGVRLADMPPTPFVPEIPHAEVALEGVRVRPEDVLPGDGYDDYLKPFRTIEDLHVHGALLGHLLRMARTCAWPRLVSEDLLDQLCGLRALALESPRAPEVHLALAGAIARARTGLQQLEPLWAQAPQEVRVRWQRDTPLLFIADAARTERTERAWQALAPQAPGASF